MSKKTNFFRIAAEGMALNGHPITREMITQMAANYNPVKYTANINVEHVRGFSLGNSGFPTLGKVLALEARNFTDVDGATKLGLYSQIEAYEPLIQAHKAKQKLGWSIEPRKFPDNDEFYLFGLASTDSPASLYTEALEFNLLKNEDKTLMFSEYLASDFDFEPEKTETKPNFFSTWFSKQKPTEPEPIQILEPKIGEFAFPKEFTDELRKFSTAFEGALDRIDHLEKQNNELISKFSLLEKTPAESTGHPSTNNADNIVLADC